MNCLWSVLDDLDDLTSSTNNILELLSSILVHPQFNHAGYICQSAFYNSQFILLGVENRQNLVLDYDCGHQRVQNFLVY